MDENNGELQSIEINLNMMNEEQEQLDELFNPLAAFGNKVKVILKQMFGGGSSVPVNIRGTSSQVRNFTRTLGNEKSYIQNAAKYGLDNPRTYRSKFKLQGVIKKFEIATGLKRPVK